MIGMKCLGMVTTSLSAHNKSNDSDTTHTLLVHANHFRQILVKRFIPLVIREVGQLHEFLDRSTLPLIIHQRTHKHSQRIRGQRGKFLCERCDFFQFGNAHANVEGVLEKDILMMAVQWSQTLHDTVELVEIGVTGKERLAGDDLGMQTSDRPYVHWLSILCITHQEF